MKNKMRMVSTRGGSDVTIDEAILSGLAPDGGLFVPQILPEYNIRDFYNISDMHEFAAHLLAPFFQLSQIKMDAEFCKEVFTFPLPLHHLDKKNYVLELFHGPTLSFKDFGARFFAQCLQELLQERRTKVLVATSGDTGSAVASALYRKEGIEGIILFPKDKISLRQQLQITCWSDNICALAVNGSFDQCQRLVKTAFAEMRGVHDLTTANSINIARLLPQVLFYAYSSIKVATIHNQEVNFVVPSGNLGNVTACYWAKFLGFPIDKILIANNANKVLVDLIGSGTYEPRASISTLASAMDVGDPSNLERLVALFSSFGEFKEQMDIASVEDLEIKGAIVECYEKFGYLICPHTATAYHRLQSIQSNKPWVIMATAHPAKFEEIIEPLLGISIPVPEQLEMLLHRKQNYSVIEPKYELLRGFIERSMK